MSELVRTISKKFMSGPRPAAVTRQQLIEILSSSEFYRTCVTFAFLEDSTLARLRAYKELVSEGQPDQRRLGDEILLPFLRHAQELRRKDPNMLAPLGRYLQEKLDAKQEEFMIRCCGSGGCFAIRVPTKIED
jgi:hypothetical protein